MRMLLIAFLLFPLMVFCQSKKDSLWQPFKSLIGNWKGAGEGEPGKGDYERSFQFVLDNNFIEIRNKSTYPPSTQNNGKGEVHEDIGYISYDRGRQTFVLRQFHKEGFVNQYKLDSISADRKTLVFVSEAIENIAKGWRTKEIWHIGENSFSESFELAEPGKDFAVYTKSQFLKEKN